MKYVTVMDCWHAAEKATTIKELAAIIREFPRWSGEWIIEVVRKRRNGEVYSVVRLTNYYWDSDAEETISECEDLDIEYQEEEEE